MLKITKELFIESVNKIKKQYEHDSKCSDALKVILPNDYISSYDNSLIFEQLIKILKIYTNDNHKDSIIDYYIYELDFGKKWTKKSILEKNKDGEYKPIVLISIEDLWNYLTSTTSTTTP